MRKHWSTVRRELMRVRKKLERLNQAKRTTVDLAKPRQRALNQIAKDITQLHLTADSAAATDMIIDGHATEWRQSVERLHDSRTAELDHLEAEVGSIVARLNQRCLEEHDRLVEIQSVAANIWDQVGDPEEPTLDPLR